MQLPIRKTSLMKLLVSVGRNTIGKPSGDEQTDRYQSIWSADGGRVGGGYKYIREGRSLNFSPRCFGRHIIWQKDVHP